MQVIHRLFNVARIKCAGYKRLLPGILAFNNPSTLPYSLLAHLHKMSQFPSQQPVPDLASAAGYLLGHSNYPSLFRSADEVPQFFVSYRWWEDEVTTILWAFDAQEIKRVIRYGLFQDEHLPRKVLQTRNAATIDTFLLTLVEPHERALFPSLSHTQKVEEIVRRCRVATPSLVSWGWFPACKDGDLTPLAIAEAIDAESQLHFTRISFEELVRYSLGWPSSRVDWFLQQHTVFYVHLLNYLNAFPEDRGRYVKVEKHLRERSPFAHRALARCLLAVQGISSQADLSSNTPQGFEFFAGPIQRLFRDLPPSLTLILKVLSVLGVRFQRTYVHARAMEWTRPFNVAFSFLEDLLGSTSSMDFARTLTNADERDFSGIVEQGIFDQSLIQRLCIQWELLSLDVWECCTALPDMVGSIQECLQPLLLLRTYHSFMAVLTGLHKYSVSESSACVETDTPTASLAPKPVLPPDLVHFLDPFQNYAAYRQQFENAAGIPFLIPHMREYQQKGEPVLRQLALKLENVVP
ncbi:hypothetical protein AOCH_001522 [Aspergillus ochraceoroseus]|uniref:Ras-GEF domain-containing protein n=2 Tax=Aspergillus ochraceoroseus TaxID=138278 RepID=A0A0F8U2R3_9EURO|nr:hypothetical protein AOCH_001522 [Aspergillus ochraceoroseus]